MAAWSTDKVWKLIETIKKIQLFLDTSHIPHLDERVLYHFANNENELKVKAVIDAASFCEEYRNHLRKELFEFVDANRGKPTVSLMFDFSEDSVELTFTDYE